jgi:hypothetical protein
MRHTLILAVLLLVAKPALAQVNPFNPFNLQEGDRIRLTDSQAPNWIDANVMQTGPLYFSYTTPGQPDRIFIRSYREVDNLQIREVSRSESARGGALWGLYIGSAIGIVSGPFLANVLSLDTGIAIGAVGSAGALGGALTGAVTGALLSPGRWYRYVKS